MANIKVKIKDGTEVLYDSGNIDTLVLPTSDGTGAVFRKWNGVTEITTKLSVVCRNIVKSTTVQKSVDTAVSVAVTS